MADALMAAAVLLRERHASDERGIGLALANLLEAIGDCAGSDHDDAHHLGACMGRVAGMAELVAAAVSRPRPDRESWTEYGYRLSDGTVRTSGYWDDPWSMVADAMQAAYDDGHEDAEVVQRTWVSGPWLPYVDEWAGVGPKHATVVDLPDGSVAVVHGDEPLSEEGLAATREVLAAAQRRLAYESSRCNRQWAEVVIGRDKGHLHTCILDAGHDGACGPLCLGMAVVEVTDDGR